MKFKFKPKPTTPLDHKRDAYGFSVRPQHVQRYREYANIYKEEEEERSNRWKHFLERVSVSSSVDESSVEVRNEKEGFKTSEVDIIKERSDSIHTPISDGPVENGVEELKALLVEDKKLHKVHTWSNIRPTLHIIEDLMSVRVKKRTSIPRKGQENDAIEETRPVKSMLDEDSEEEFYDVERSDPTQDVPFSDSTVSSTTDGTCDETNVDFSSPWKDELDVLVRGGLPMALRGELWQAFVGVKARRTENYYQGLLSRESNHGDKTKQEFNDNESGEESVVTCEKWKGQIEKDLPRTFPGHPALDGDCRNALRRVLTAYARHNPSVGYCQAMNFFAGLLLLLMPEENAFWTLMGIMDDYFDGYYTEEMIECQVDQCVFEDLVRERFPKLVNHLDYLGVQVAWLTGPWFLSIFMNILPWESVLRVWDVILFEGNRVMLFRTALALMELYGPALVTTKDAGDAVTLLQSLAGSTFDSSQLVFTACMGYQNVNETRLDVLRNKHRASVISAIEERSKGLRDLKNSRGLESKMGNFKHDPRSVLSNNSRVCDEQVNDDGSVLDSGSSTSDDCLLSMNGGVDIDPGQDLQEQVVWLKDELCKLLEEKRSAELRAEELETALMEMVKQDNRRQLSAKVEQLEQEVLELRHALSGKQEQEHVMLQVLMRVEQEQKVTEDARRFAEQAAIAQKESAQALQEKYEQVAASLAEMEKRAVMAESMLEATLQYQSGQLKSQSSPRMESPTETTPRKTGLLARPFGLGWLDKNKGKPTTAEESSDSKLNVSADAQSPGIQQEKRVD